MRTQSGSLFESHGAWHVRYREQVQQPDGSVKRVQRAQRLASRRDYPKKSEVVPLKNEFMAKLNRIGFRPEVGVSLVEFVEKTYFPTIEKRLAKSTVKGYQDAWKCHIKKRVVGVRVRDFRTGDGENLMQDIEREHGTELAHGTYAWIKITLSAMFTHARRAGLFDGANPMQGVTIPKGKKHGRKRQAYTLEEIKQLLSLFDNPTRVILATAAYTGLRLGELRGLWWEDDRGDTLVIRRSMWRSDLKDTKTGEDDDQPGVVPIIQPLRAMLDGIKPKDALGFMFPNSIQGSLDLTNLVDRVIQPKLAEHGLTFKGWHAFRRGLATNMKGLGVPDTTIQAILRHEDASTTRRHYIKSVSADVTEAMKKLELQIVCATNVQQPQAGGLIN